MTHFAGLWPVFLIMFSVTLGANFLWFLLCFIHTSESVPQTKWWEHFARLMGLKYTLNLLKWSPKVFAALLILSLVANVLPQESRVYEPIVRLMVWSASRWEILAFSTVSIYLAGLLFRRFIAHHIGVRREEVNPGIAQCNRSVRQFLMDLGLKIQMMALIPATLLFLGAMNGLFG